LSRRVVPCSASHARISARLEERAALGRGAALAPELQPCGGLPVAGVLDPVSGEPLLCDRAPDVHRGAQAGAVPVDTRGDPDAVALATHD
jgi:hypothetical protein